MQVIALMTQRTFEKTAFLMTLFNQRGYIGQLA